MGLEERQVRDLRDLLFGSVITDQKWSLCRDNWMKPENVEWLKQKVAEIPEREKRLRELFEEAEKDCCLFPSLD